MTKFQSDLPFFPGLDAAREAVLRVPVLMEGRFLVAIAAQETTFTDARNASPGPCWRRAASIRTRHRGTVARAI